MVTRTKASATSSTWTGKRMKPLLGKRTASPEAGRVTHCTWSVEPRTLSGPVTLAGRMPVMFMP